MRAREIMTRELVTLTPEMPMAAAAEVLSRAHIHRAPVMDRAGRLVGMVSVVDLVTPIARTVQGVMAWDPIAAEQDTAIEAVAALLLEHRVRLVPIVPDGKAVGIISASGIVRVFLSRHEEVRSYGAPLSGVPFQEREPRQNRGSSPGGREHLQASADKLRAFAHPLEAETLPELRRVL